MARLKENPVKYVLYSHYAYSDARDLKGYLEGEHVDKLPGVKHFESHLRGLKELLTVPGYEGMLVLFYAVGYEEFLKIIAERDEQPRTASQLECGNAVKEQLKTLLVKYNLSERVRIVVPLDLEVILGKVNTITAQLFQDYFIGSKPGIRYDAPKIVEAILRLRLLGNGVPVFRLDHDVLFRDNEDIGDLGLFKSVACALRAYRLRMDDPTVSTFVFSASYNSRDLLKKETPDRFKAWSRAFATRVYPALIFNVDTINKIYHSNKNEQKDLWDAYISNPEMLVDALLYKYYGLMPEHDGLESDGIEGLTGIGAHPLYAVISGALLCMSEGAILDLPPFSNFQTNIMWIDDHLKYSLHRAMEHFTSGDTLDLEPGLSDARLDNVMVTKARPRPDDLAVYIFNSYLPTLLWGTIFDAWITNHSILKCRIHELNEEQKDRWRQARSKMADAPLPEALLTALNKGHFDRPLQRSLEHKLEQLTVTRINTVREHWTNLNYNGIETFASIWINGKVENSGIDKTIFNGCSNELWKGIPREGKIQTLSDLPTCFFNEIKTMIDDTVDYISWSLEWPKFTQIVRSIPQGRFCGDINFGKIPYQGV